MEKSSQKRFDELDKRLAVMDKKLDYCYRRLDYCYSRLDKEAREHRPLPPVLFPRSESRSRAITHVSVKDVLIAAFERLERDGL